MRKGFTLMLIAMLAAILVACGDDASKDEADSDELKMLDVDFDVPETADVGDTVELTATVTYGDDPVPDADEVLFEIWESGHEDDSEKIEPENNEDGTYTLEYTFEEEGIYEMYAHTTAHALHVMPKKQIAVGDVEVGAEEHSHDNGEDAEHFHTEGFELHFNEPENPTANGETNLTTHIMMHEEALKELQVRYEIWPEDDEDAIEWADATEENNGEYVGNYTFPDAGTYMVQIHVKDDKDLHEHKIESVEVQ